MPSLRVLMFTMHDSAAMIQQTLLRRKLGVSNNVELLRYAQMHRLFGD
jgi:hypothetical protein